MLQGLAQFCVAVLQFLEQSDVLDGDDRLVGEGFDQLDLPFGKRLNYVTPYNDAANWRSFSQQWCS
jgi:hypothetical protein